jgi:hypothetical protein
MRISPFKSTTSSCSSSVLLPRISAISFSLFAMGTSTSLPLDTDGAALFVPSRMLPKEETRDGEAVLREACGNGALIQSLPFGRVSTFQSFDIFTSHFAWTNAIIFFVTLKQRNVERKQNFLRFNVIFVKISRFARTKHEMQIFFLR